MPGQVGLAAERGPVEEQRDVRVGLELARLAGPEGAGEEQGVVLEPLQGDRPRRGPPAVADGDEGRPRRAGRGRARAPPRSTRASNAQRLFDLGHRLKIPAPPLVDSRPCRATTSTTRSSARPTAPTWSARASAGWWPAVVGRQTPGPTTRAWPRSARLPTGGTIVDCPCGAGPALRALSPDADVRYVAADLSPAMLRRARTRAAKRGLERGRVRRSEGRRPALGGRQRGPLPLLLGNSRLPGPAGGRGRDRPRPEAGRAPGRLVLRPRRQPAPAPDAAAEHHRLRADVHRGRSCSEWLAQAGLRLVDSSRSGLFLFFEATLGGAGSAELGDQQPQP